MTQISKEQLIEAAKKAYKNAYAPYSKFSVGSAAVAKSGKLYSGCNVENASYGLTMCAERNCIGQAVVNGDKEFKALVIYTEIDTLTPPCGACRQVISEFLEPDAYVTACNHLGNERSWQVKELLPDSFGPKDLK